MARGVFGVCQREGCNWTGNLYDDDDSGEGARHANDELSTHLHQHIQAGESGGHGMLEYTEAS